APACAALASRAIAANSQRCVRIMEGGPRNGWRKSAKRKLNKHFAHPVQGTTEATAGGRRTSATRWRLDRQARVEVLRAAEGRLDRGRGPGGARQMHPMRGHVSRDTDVCRTGLAQSRMKPPLLGRRGG